MTRYRQRNLPGVRSRKHPYTCRKEEAGENREILVPETLGSSEEDCELCGTQMFGLHCKLICPNCGYRRDCSDP